MVLQFMWGKDFLLHGTQKTLGILVYVFDWLYFIQCTTSFSSIDQLDTIFDAISSNIDKVLPINPFANVIVFGDFNYQNF